jgi:hypothetical protein
VSEIPEKKEKKAFVPLTEETLPRIRDEEDEKGKGGRPQIPVDLDLLRKLAKLHLSHRTIADCLRISVRTLDRRYGEQIDIWQSDTDAKLAEVIVDEALNRRRDYAVKMLAQKRLGYYNKVEIKTPGTTTRDELDDMSSEELRSLATDLLAINE